MALDPHISELHVYEACMLKSFLSSCIFITWLHSVVYLLPCFCVAEMSYSVCSDLRVVIQRTLHCGSWCDLLLGGTVDWDMARLSPGNAALSLSPSPARAARPAPDAQGRDKVFRSEYSGESQGPRQVCCEFLIYCCCNSLHIIIYLKSIYAILSHTIFAFLCNFILTACW